MQNTVFSTLWENVISIVQPALCNPFATQVPIHTSFMQAFYPLACTIVE